MIYTLGRDRDYRPIIIFDIGKISKSTQDFETTTAATHYLFDFVKNHLLVPGKVENWIVIIDCRGVTTGEISKNNVKQVIREMGKFYPCRLEVMLVIHLPKFYKFIWKFVMFFMDKHTNNKIQILGSNYLDVIQRHVDPLQLENKFGGKIKDIVRRFFPPKVKE